MSTSPLESEEAADPSAGAVVEAESDGRILGLPLYVWVVLAVLLAIPTGIFWGERRHTARASADRDPSRLDGAGRAAGRAGDLERDRHQRGEGPARRADDGLLPAQYSGGDVDRSGAYQSDQPGQRVPRLLSKARAPVVLTKKTATDLLLDLVPTSVGEPFTKNHLAQLVVLTIALGIGLVKIRDQQKARGETSFKVVVDLLTIGFELLMKVLLWVVALVPLAVFGIVASIVGKKEGLKFSARLIWLIVVVVLGLALQVLWYLLQMAVVAKMSPWRFMRGLARGDGQHDQHVEHSRDDSDHAEVARAAGSLAALEPVDGVHRHKLQQRRNSPLHGDGRTLHGAGIGVELSSGGPGHDHADDADCQRRCRWDSFG